jgi:hypothetical protein
MERFKPATHDQGHVGVHFDCPQAAILEPLNNILDQNLGDRLSIKAKGRTAGALDASAITDPFDIIVGRRLKRLCTDCSTAEVTRRCECTLRKHFLDRWLCIECYVEEVDRNQFTDPSFASFGSSRLVCGCLNVFDPMTTSPKIICKWCGGEVIDELGREEDVEAPEQEDMDSADHESYIDADPVSGMHWQWVPTECISLKIQLQWRKRAAQLQGEDERAAP